MAADESHVAQCCPIFAKGVNMKLATAYIKTECAAEVMRDSYDAGMGRHHLLYGAWNQERKTDFSLFHTAPLKFIICLPHSSSK